MTLKRINAISAKLERRLAQFQGITKLNRRRQITPFLKLSCRFLAHHPFDFIFKSQTLRRAHQAKPTAQFRSESTVRNSTLKRFSVETPSTDQPRPADRMSRIIRNFQGVFLKQHGAYPTLFVQFSDAIATACADGPQKAPPFETCSGWDRRAP
ncbi:MAG: hypothetical protein OIF48_05270 [Silicimonas sp.]|nr:hypothetical protein [Silicimonas sp.]